MFFSFENQENIYFLDTSVPNIFILEHLRNSEDVYIKQYLISLMYAQQGNEISKDELSRFLGISLSSIDKGFKYWEEEGLLKRVFNDYGDYDVRFIRPNVSQIMDKKVPEEEDSSRSNKELFIQDVFSRIEEIKGNPLSASEIKFVKNILNNTVEISPELLIYAYEVAVLRNKDNINYVSTILDSWVNKGILTVKAAKIETEEFSNRFNNKRQILSSLGLRRMATSGEDILLDSILDNFGLSLEEILNVSKTKLSKYRNPNVELLLKEIEKESKAKEDKVVLTIDDYYRELRVRAKDISEKNRKKIFSEYPDIEDVYKDIEKIKLNLLSPGNANLEELKETYKVLLNKRDKMLKERGFTSDDLTVQYRCHLCKDTGQLDNGNTCECYLQRISELKSGLK